MDRETFLTRFQERCPHLIRCSWKPVKTNNPARLPIISTKFGGINPWLSDKYKWPQCKQCKNPSPMSFLCQINLADLPQAMKESTQLDNGILQCFYCLECEYYDKVRIIPEREMEVNSLRYLSAVSAKDMDTGCIPRELQKYVNEINKTTASHSLNCKVFDEHFVGSWEQNEYSEIPLYDELHMSRDELRNLLFGDSDDYMTMVDEILDEMNDSFDNAKIAVPNCGTKLGGWGRWWQSVEYPDCPDCKTKMNFVFLQLEEEELLEQMWADCVTAHITLCPVCHKPGMGWALF